MGIRGPRDFWAGAIYLALAAVVILIGRNYAFGSSARMGPGYFPVVLGAILALVGAISVTRSFLKPGEPVGPFAWRPLLLILGAVVLFGLLLERAGVIIALAALMTVGAFASRTSRFDFATVASFTGLIALCVLVFVKGLGVPMPLIGSWFGG
jgi:hypothetical protein